MYKILLSLLFLAASYTGRAFDSCAYYKRKLDTTRHQLYMANSQVNAVKFYIKICEKKPSNKKFFYGWISNRAIKK